MPTAHRILIAATLDVAVLFSSGLASAQTDDPVRNLWLNLKQKLSGPNGEAYYNLYVKNSALPT
jgi:hypothetical protein